MHWIVLFIFAAHQLICISGMYRQRTTSVTYTHRYKVVHSLEIHQEEKRHSAVIYPLMNHDQTVKQIPDFFEKAKSTSKEVIKEENEYLKNIIGLDCEFVVGKKNDFMLARVSLVNGNGEVLLDKYVRPTGKVKDYVTWVSGVTEAHLEGENVLEFDEARLEVLRRIEGKIVVGHQLNSDFKVLQITHPAELIRDTAKYIPLRMDKKFVEKGFNPEKTPALRDLAACYLELKNFQKGPHSSVEDAKAPIEIYLMFRDQWEADIKKSENEIGEIVDNFDNMKLTNDQYHDGKYYRILARYEIREDNIMWHQQQIIRDYNLDAKMWDNLLYQCKIMKEWLETPIQNDLIAYLNKFQAFADLMYAYEENEAARNFELNITGIPLDKVHVTPKNKMFIAYAFTYEQWKPEYRKRGHIVVGEAHGVIVQVDQESKRIVAMFTTENAAKLQPQQRLSVTANAAGYNVLNTTFVKVRKNALLFQTIVFPNAQNLTTFNEFLHERNAKWPEFIKKCDKKRNFNQEQLEAIFSIVNGTNGNIPFILWGPPGTGKTSTIMEAVRQLMQANNTNRILITSPSNMTADMMAMWLLTEGIVKTTELRRLYSPGKEVSERERKLDPVVCIEKVLFMGEPDDQFGICDLTNIRIVVMTLTASANLEEARIGGDFFSHIFVDEAAQAMEADTLIPIARYMGKNTRVILAGDHKQLGPVVMARFLKDNFPSSYSSMMSRLIEKYPVIYKDRRFSVELIRNYRSHAKILEFPSNTFYKGRLIAANTANRQSFVNLEFLPKKGVPIIFHITDGHEEKQGGSKSFWNQKEVEVVQNYINALLLNLSSGIPADLRKEHIGVISPYRLQTQKIRSALGHANRDVTVDSVERFQGSERRVIIMTLTRSNDLGFLKEETRINTSLTRAQELLIVIVSAQLLRKIEEERNWNGEIWHNFYQFCQQNGAIVDERDVDVPLSTKLGNHQNTNGSQIGRGSNSRGRQQWRIVEEPSVPLSSTKLINYHYANRSQVGRGWQQWERVVGRN